MAHRLVACVLAALVLTLLPASVASAQTPSSILRGDLPTEGGTGLLAAVQELSVEAFLREAGRAGCETTLLAVTEDGLLVTYVPGAPDFVNASFPARLDAGAPVLVQCAKPPPDVPDLRLLTLVTKQDALEADYVPEGLVALSSDVVMPGVSGVLLTEEAAEALGDLLEAAEAEGYVLRVRSAYRSYAEQVSTYQYWVALLGEEEAARRSARPGHSEHQLGTVVDVSMASLWWELEPELGATPAGKWLVRNAWRYGFVESYPEGAEAITGYAYEPWHLRYIGRTHAEWLRGTSLTLTEYLEALWGEIE